MATFQVPLANGVYLSKDLPMLDVYNFNMNHQMNFSLNATSTPTAGQVEIKAKGPSSEGFEVVPDGVIQLTDLSGLTFQYKTTEYEFTVSGSDGVGILNVTDANNTGT